MRRNLLAVAFALAFAAALVAGVEASLMLDVVLR